MARRQAVNSRGRPLDRSDQKPDVMIVGAGAAGTMLALELARFGVPFRMVDRQEGPSAFSRAINVQARMLEIFERIDPVLRDRFLKLGVQCPGYVLHYAGQDGERRTIRPGLDFTRLDSSYPFLLLNAQNDTERLVREYTQEQYGLGPEWGVTCTGVAQDGETVTAQLRHADGSAELAQSRFLVACDGAGSRIRQQLGLLQEGSELEGVVLQNLDVVLKGFPDDEDWVHYCMGPGHFLMVAKLPPGYSRLLMSQKADIADPEATPHQVFSDILARHFDGIGFGDTIWHSRWQSHERLATRYRAGNVFLAGDAAHVHSTGGGQGLNCCMQDSHNLGWKLAMVLKGRCAPALLDTYETERKPIGAQVIAAASSIHELFMAGREHSPEEVTAMQETGELADLVARVSGLAYHYRQGGGAAPLQSGDRAPDAAVAGSGHLYDLTRHTRFTLVAMVPEGADRERAAELMDAYQYAYPDILEVALLQPAPHPYDFRPDATLLLLIRPDGYIGACCGADQRQRLDHYLRELAGPPLS